MKKWLVTATAVLTGLVIAGCSNDTVASSTAGKISQEELYDAMKESYGEQTLQQLLMKDVLSDQYGDKVSDKDVQAQYNQEMETYGGEEQFNQVLSYSGYTKESYQDLIKQSLLMEAAVKANTDFKDEEIKKAYESYEPPMTASHILVADEKTAKEVIDQLNDGADFADLAKKYSTDTGTAKDGGQVTFSKGEMVPEFEEAALKLKEGEYTKDPVKSDYGFHVIKMDKKPEKESLDKEKDAIKDQLTKEKLSDNDYVAKVLSKVFKDANIIINDEDLQHAMDAYLQSDADSSKSTDSSEVTDSSEATSDKDSSKDEADKDSSSKE